MENAEIRAIVERQRAYFQTGATLPLKARLRTLAALQNAMERYRERVQEALRADLGKCETEAFMTETGLSISELSFVRKRLPRWMKDRAVPTPLANFPAHSFLRPMPYGVTLILSPWNYPYLLSIDPLIDALAAGNTVILKPSAYSPAVSGVLNEMLREGLPPELCAVVTGGRAENQSLLEQNFDYIFFTGSQAVGKDVLRHAAEHLTPVTLELGGKSPCFVDETAKLGLAARRIVFGKFLNCGQTCVAPDYILCDRTVKEELVRRILQEIRRQIGDKPFENPEYGKIVNEKHFTRLLGLIDPAKTVYGGENNPASLQIAPTVMDNVTPDDAVMKEEIFGPILPVLTVENAEEAAAFINSRPRPLALYAFTQDRKTARFLTTRCAFGGGCVNDTVIHLASSHMGFGGVGESGMGAYHGKTGFDTFSHSKSVTEKKTWIDLNMRYRPYTKAGERLIRLFLR